MRKPSVLVIFFTVFIDLIGFGIVIPSIPTYSSHLGAHGWEIGMIIASFSAMQFVFSPIWGRLSDRHGRRPILLLSTAGASISYVLYALSATLQNHHAALWLMILSRAFAGLFGGNITVAQAYMADISPPEQRSRRMGLIGMAFGLGFIFGPAFGGLSIKYIGATGPGWVAAAFCALNFLLAFSILAESRQPGSAHVAPRPHLRQWVHTLTQPKIGVLVITFFLATFCFSCFESTLPLIVSDNFHFHLGVQAEASRVTSIAMYLFVYCGLISSFVQGGAIGPLVKRLGEVKLIAISLLLTALTMAVLPFISGTPELSWGVLFNSQGHSWRLLLGALALLSVGTSLYRPPLFGLLSNLTSAHEQGANIGVAQGAGSLARVLGPIFATGLLPVFPALPYLICAAILVVTILVVAQAFRQQAVQVPERSPAPAAE